MSGYRYREQVRFTPPEPQPRGGPISPERADELRAQWRAIADAWKRTVPMEDLERHARTFHPEFFANERAA